MLTRILCFTILLSMVVCNHYGTLFHKDFSESEIIDKQGWYINQDMKMNPISRCGFDNMLGGFGIFGQGVLISKQFVNLPAHYKVTIRFNFFKIDSWDGENLIVQADGVELLKKSYTFTQGYQVCGQAMENWNDLREQFELTFEHTSENLVVVLTTTLNQDASDVNPKIFKLLQESWGINNFEVYVQECPSECQVCNKENLDSCQNWDLAYEGLTGYSVQTEKWQIENAPADSLTSCAGVQILGGYQKFGNSAVVRNSFKLPTHSKVLIKIQFWKIDSWDTENLIIKVDGQQIHTKSFVYTEGLQLCGRPNDNWNELVYDVWVEGPHQADVMNLELTTSLNQDASDESWGIRNFQLFYM